MDACEARAASTHGTDASPHPLQCGFNLKVSSIPKNDKSIRKTINVNSRPHEIQIVLLEGDKLPHKGKTNGVQLFEHSFEAPEAAASRGGQACSLRNEWPGSSRGSLSRGDPEVVVPAVIPGCFGFVAMTVQTTGTVSLNDARVASLSASLARLGCAVRQSIPGARSSR